MKLKLKLLGVRDALEVLLPPCDEPASLTLNAGYTSVV
jgi:hypothetical protein